MHQNDMFGTISGPESPAWCAEGVGEDTLCCALCVCICSSLGEGGPLTVLQVNRKLHMVPCVSQSFLLLYVKKQALTSHG